MPRAHTCEAKHTPPPRAADRPHTRSSPDHGLPLMAQPAPAPSGRDMPRGCLRSWRRALGSRGAPSTPPGAGTCPHDPCPARAAPPSQAGTCCAGPPPKTRKMALLGSKSTSRGARHVLEPELTRRIGSSSMRSGDRSAPCDIEPLSLLLGLPCIERSRVYLVDMFLVM